MILRRVRNQNARRGQRYVIYWFLHLLERPYLFVSQFDNGIGLCTGAFHCCGASGLACASVVCLCVSSVLIETDCTGQWHSCDILKSVVCSLLSPLSTVELCRNALRCTREFLSCGDPSLLCRVHYVF